jgi:hypothetical protein
MTAFSNSRRHPYENTIAWRNMTDEVHTIQEFDELPGVYGIELQDRPNPSAIDIFFTGTGWMTGDGVTGLTQLTQINTSNPSAGQFRVGGGQTGKIICNIADDGKQVVVQYQGGGTTTAFQNIYNLILDIIGTITDTFDRIFVNHIRARTSAGLTLESNSSTLIGTFGAGGGNNGTFEGGVNIKGAVGVGDGTVSNPGLHFEQDTNTGLYRIGADEFGLATNGVLRASVGSYGVYSPGSIVQVVSTTKTDTFSTSSTSFVDITGLSATITPRFTTSKILVHYTISDSQNSNSITSYKLVRGSTEILIGGAAGSRTRATSARYPAVTTAGNILTHSVMGEDTPNTTSSTTYKIQTRVAGGTAFINRSDDDTDITNRSRTISTITLMEIAG